MSTPGADADEGSERIQLETPASTEHLRLVRLLVSSLAASHGATINDLEDLRIAAGEVCAQVISGAEPEDRLQIRAQVRRLEPSGVELYVAASVPGRAVLEPMDELSSMVLDAAAHQHGIDRTGADSVAWFSRILESADHSVD